MSLPQEQFRIAIDAFDGPLDLLLHLVRRAEVDIHDIPISQITDEYLEVLRQSAFVDVEMAGEFLVMAATLIEIKSRSLVPPEQAIEDDQEHGEQHQSEDPRSDLIRQLLSYQRFRTASELLEERRNAFALRYTVQIGIPKQPMPDNEPSLELDDVHFLDLSDAYEHIATAIDFTQLDGHHIVFDDVPIELCQEELIERLNRSPERRLTLQSTFSGLPLAERVGLFLATLELVRMQQVTVYQDDAADGDIVIVLFEEPISSGEQSAQAH